MATVFRSELINILLGEIQALGIQILEIIVQKPFAQFLVEWKTRKMAILEHDRHLPSHLVEISLLGLRGTGNRK
jgi:hypothetical protein